MKTTECELLKADYDFVCKELKQSRLMIEQLRKEKDQAHYDSYKQGRFDEQMDNLNK